MTICQVYLRTNETVQVFVPICQNCRKMEEFFHSITKILAHTIVVHVYSVPNFAIECFITAIMCVVHILLIVEINSLVSNIIEKSIAKLKRQRIMRDDSKPSSLISLKSGETNIKMQHHVRKYYENHSPLIPPNYTTKKLTKIPEMQSSDYNWMPTTAEEEKYEKIDQMLSVSPSDYIKKDKEKKIHENELRHCLKSLSTLLESSVPPKMSTTSRAKSTRDALKTAKSSENITDNNNKAMENNKKTTESLFDIMERSLTHSAKEEGVTSHDDRGCEGNLEGNLSIHSSSSDTSADMDLDSLSNITDVKQ